MHPLISKVNEVLLTLQDRGHYSLYIDDKNRLPSDINER